MDMAAVEQDLLLHQVMTGTTRCLIINTPYYVCAASPAHKLEAQHLFCETLHEASFQGVLTEEEMLEVLIENNLWSSEEENELQSAPTRLDALKVDMYQRFINYQSRRMEQAKRMAMRLRKRQVELAMRRHQYDLYTQTGLAQSVKLQYLISRNTKDANHESVNLESQSEWLLREMLVEYNRNRPDESALRKLSQYGRWRMMWASGKQEGRVFGVPSTWFTEEQQNLIAWSKMYDNINEHPEPPPKEVLEDEDLLDGWIILEQKKREKEQRERTGMKSNKPGAQEMFIPAETAEDAKRIEAMNEPGMKFIKRQRMAALKDQKVVGEQHMPDSKQQISLQAAQEFRDRMKNARRR